MTSRITVFQGVKNLQFIRLHRACAHNSLCLHTGCSMATGDGTCVWFFWWCRLRQVIYTDDSLDGTLLDLRRCGQRFLRNRGLHRNIRLSNNLLVLRFSPCDLFLMPELIHHSSTVDSQQADRAVVLFAVMAQELDPEVSCPNERVLDKEGLHFTSVSGFKGAEILPFLGLHGIAIRHRDAEVPEYGAKEFVVCQDDGVDQDVVAEFNDEEFIGC